MSKPTISQLIRDRRSVYPKNYTGEKVSDKIIQEMLENANWAPTHKFTEPWRFSIFCDEGMATFIKMHEEINSKEKKIDTDKLQNKLSKCSHVISIGMKRNKSIPKMEEIAAVASAVQNMQLTAASYGIGCYWSTGGLTYISEAKSLFDLDEKDKLMGFLYVGMPKEDIKQKGRRSPIENKIKWIKS